MGLSFLSPSQFINDKFLYNHTVAMELLIQNGMKDHLLELAMVSKLQHRHYLHTSFLILGDVPQAHHSIGEALEQLIASGSPELDLTLQAMLTSKQFAEPLNAVADGG